MRRLTAEALLAAQNVLLLFQPLSETRLDIINVMRRYEKMALHSVAKKKGTKSMYHHLNGRLMTEWEVRQNTIFLFLVLRLLLYVGDI